MNRVNWYVTANIPMQIVREIHISEDVRITYYQFVTDLHIYSCQGSYVVIDDDAAIWFIDKPSCSITDHAYGFMREDKKYDVYLYSDGRIGVSCGIDILLSEPVDDTSVSRPLYVKNVRHDGNTTRLTVLALRLIIDLLIQW